MIVLSGNSRLTCARNDQSAGPRYFCSTLRAWTQTPAIPTLKAPRAIFQKAGGPSSFSRKARRSLSVTGRSGTASRTARTISIARPGSAIKYPPRFRARTFLTGQAKFKSMTSKPIRLSAAAARAMTSGSLPMIWPATGWSASSSLTSRRKSLLSRRSCLSSIASVVQ